MNKDEAERSLKVLNSDLVNLGAKISESPEFDVLNLLASDTIFPVPFKKNKNGFPKYREYSFFKNKGVYSWNNNLKIMEKLADNDYVILHLDYFFEDDVVFTLMEYEFEKVYNHSVVPTRFSGFITLNDHKIWEVAYSSTITDNLPKMFDLKILGEQYSIYSNLERTRINDSGTINFSFNFSKSFYKIIESKLFANIGYSNQGYYINNLEIDQKIFEHYLVGFVNYSLIDPTADDYAQSFNENTNMSLFEDKNKKVGDLVLATTEGGELLDYAIKFSDNSVNFIGNYIPYFDNLLNFKY